MMSSADITIVVTSFNSDQIIQNCLSSIDRKYNVILVENSHREDFKKEIEEEYSNIRCILTGSNLGYGKANNIGLKNVKSKYALILNPDASLQETTIDNFFKTINEIPDFAIMGPYIQEENNKVHENNLNNNKPKEVMNVKGFGMFLNLKEFKEVGFFDENFFIYFEEIDLCKRLINNKKKIYLVPGIKINHSGGQSHNTDINTEMELSRNWHWMWSTFYYHKKYKGFFISFLIILPKLVSSIFKTFFYILTLNKKKKDIYYQRSSGLINSIIGNHSSYRPKV